MRLRPRRRRPSITVTMQPDALPRTGLFAEPVRVTRLELERAAPVGPDASASDPDVPASDGTSADAHEVRFLLEVRDAEGRRCPDLAVEAMLDAPGRTTTVVGNTDLMGRLVVRTRGPAGTYRLTVTDVAAGGLAWDADLGPSTVVAEVPVGPAG